MPSQSGKERNCDVTVRLLSGSPTHFSSQAGSTRKYHPSWKACASRLCLARRQTGKRHRGPKTAQKKHIFRDIQHSIAGRHKFDRVMWVSLSGNKEKKAWWGKWPIWYFLPPIVPLRWSSVGPEILWIARLCLSVTTLFTLASLAVGGGFHSGSYCFVFTNCYVK